MYKRYFTWWLSQQVKVTDYRVFKAYYIKARSTIGWSCLLKDRIKLLVRVLVMPVFLEYRKRQSFDSYIVDNTENFSARKVFIKGYDTNDNFDLLHSSPKSKIVVSSFYEVTIFFGAYFSSLIILVLVLFLPIKISLLQISNFLYMRTKLLIIKPKKLYVFYSYLPQNYLLALYAANVLKVDVDYIIENMVYENLRYSYFSNMRLCFTNSIYKYEYESYEKIGWIKSDGVDLFCTENSLVVQKNENFKYDLGFFSSGYWARREGLYADTNIVTLKMQKYKNNVYSRIELIILKHVIKSAKKNHLSLKIYLHPHEKKLISKHSIYPPYWNLLQSHSLEVDKSLSASKFFETKVGILLQSSIFYDRWEHNLYTICFQFKNPKNKLQVPLKYLGRYAKYGFKNLKTLENQILIGLKYNE